jgi:hypothetical protein
MLWGTAMGLQTPNLESGLKRRIHSAREEDNLTIPLVKLLTLEQEKKVNNVEGVQNLSMKNLQPFIEPFLYCTRIEGDVNVMAISNLSSHDDFSSLPLEKILGKRLVKIIGIWAKR